MVWKCRYQVALSFAAATAVGEFAALLIFGDTYARMLLRQMQQNSNPLVDLYLLATSVVAALWAAFLAPRLKLCLRDRPRPTDFAKAAVLVVVLTQISYAAVIAGDTAFHSSDSGFLFLLMVPAFLIDWVTWTFMGMIYYGGLSMGAIIAAGWVLSRQQK